MSTALSPVVGRCVALGSWLMAATLLLPGCVTERSGGTGGGGGGSPADAAAARDAAEGHADAGRDLATPLDGERPADGGPGADEGTPPDAGGPLDGALVDGALDGGPPPPHCLRPPQPGVHLEIVPDGPDTQIHASAAFDGEAVWVVYNQPEADGSGGFDVWGTRLHCDGSVAVAPFSVQAADHGNEIDPEVVVAGERVYVVWQADTGGDPNLFVYIRSFDLQGQPTAAMEQVLVPSPGGEAAVASAWMPKAAGLPDSNLLLATSWAAPLATRWQVLLQRLGPDGLPAPGVGGGPEPSVSPFPEPAVSQAYPTVAADASGRAWLAWTRMPDEGREEVVLTGLSAGSDTASPLPPQGVGPAALPGGGPALSAGPDGRVYLAMHAEGADLQVHLYDAERPTDEALHLEMGSARRQDHSPALATAPGGGVVAWYRVRSGIRNDVWLQAFRHSGSDLEAVGDPALMNPPDEAGDHAAPPIYAIAATHVGDGTFLLVWSEGSSPAFRLFGRFVHVEL